MENIRSGWCVPCLEHHDDTKPHCRSAYQYVDAAAFDAAVDMQTLAVQLDAQCRAKIQPEQQQHPWYVSEFILRKLEARET